jgi:hypothetical protein
MIVIKISGLLLTGHQGQNIGFGNRIGFVFGIVLAQAQYRVVVMILGRATWENIGFVLSIG